MAQPAPVPFSTYLSPQPAVLDAPGALSPIDRILDSVRSHLGMEIAFASRIVGGMREFTHIRADCPVPVAPGDAEPLETTLCHLVLEGQLPQLMHDAREYELALPVAITLGLPVASHLNVPLRLRDGSLYGHFCCVNRTPDRSLTERCTTANTRSPRGSKRYWRARRSPSSTSRSTNWSAARRSGSNVWRGSPTLPRAVLMPGSMKPPTLAWRSSWSLPQFARRCAPSAMFQRRATCRSTRRPPR